VRGACIQCAQLSLASVETGGLSAANQPATVHIGHVKTGCSFFLPAESSALAVCMENKKAAEF